MNQQLNTSVESQGNQPFLNQNQGQPQYNQPPQGQPQYNQPPQGQPQYNQPPQGQPIYNQPPQQGYNQQNQYNPPQQNSTNVVIQQTTTTATNAYGAMVPVMITCQTCQKSAVTRMEQNTLNIPSVLWCFFGGCWCSLIPGCCPNQTEYNHYCSCCGATVGKKEAVCC